MRMNWQRPRVSFPSSVFYGCEGRTSEVRVLWESLQWHSWKDCMHALGFPKETELASSAGEQRQHNMYKTCA